MGGEDFHGVAYHGEHSAPATIVEHEELYGDTGMFEHPAEYASHHPIRDILDLDHHHVHHTEHVAVAPVHHTEHVAVVPVHHTEHVVVAPTVHIAPAVHE